MFFYKKIMIILGAIFLTLIHNSTAFWWSNSPSENPRVAAYYLPKAMTYDAQQPVQQQQQQQQIPAIPIQSPLPAQLSPSVQNVQLVPCLCPISPEMNFEKPQE